jgi:hypothetical protein
MRGFVISFYDTLKKICVKNNLENSDNFINKLRNEKRLFEDVAD